MLLDALSAATFKTLRGCRAPEQRPDLPRDGGKMTPQQLIQAGAVPTVQGETV